MRLFYKIFNYFFVPGFIVNGLPKAGTNLLTKTVSLVPGIRYSNIQISYGTRNNFRMRNDSANAKVPIGIDWPQLVSLDAIRHTLRHIKKGTYATGHIPHSVEMSTLLTELDMKSLLILRDPRDVAVSHSFYVASYPKHFLFEFYQPLSPEERLTKSIIGIEQNGPDEPKLLNVNERFTSVLDWISHPLNFTTKFENLVGPQGGGTREIQTRELGGIIQHVGIYHRYSTITRIADQVFGGTATFRRGNIGGWQDHFTNQQKRIFKELAGQLLIDLGYAQDFDW